MNEDLFREPHDFTCRPGCVYCRDCWCHQGGLWDDNDDEGNDCG